MPPKRRVRQKPASAVPSAGGSGPGSEGATPRTAASRANPKSVLGARRLTRPEKPSSSSTPSNDCSKVNKPIAPTTVSAAATLAGPSLPPSALPLHDFATPPPEAAPDVSTLPFLADPARPPPPVSLEEPQKPPALFQAPPHVATESSRDSPLPYLPSPKPIDLVTPVEVSVKQEGDWNFEVVSSSDFGGGVDSRNDVRHLPLENVSHNSFSSFPPSRFSPLLGAVGGQVDVKTLSEQQGLPFPPQMDHPMSRPAGVRLDPLPNDFENETPRLPKEKQSMQEDVVLPTSRGDCIGNEKSIVPLVTDDGIQGDANNPQLSMESGSPHREPSPPPRSSGGSGGVPDLVPYSIQHNHPDGRLVSSPSPPLFHQGDGQDFPEPSVTSRGIDMPPDLTNMSTMGTRGPEVVEDAQPGWFSQLHQPSAIHSQPKNISVRRSTMPPQEIVSWQVDSAGTDQPENVDGITVGLGQGQVPEGLLASVSLYDETPARDSSPSRTSNGATQQSSPMRGPLAFPFQESGHLSPVGRSMLPEREPTPGSNNLAQHSAAIAMLPPTPPSLYSSVPSIIQSHPNLLQRSTPSGGLSENIGPGDGDGAAAASDNSVVPSVVNQPSHSVNHSCLNIGSAPGATLMAPGVSSPLHHPVPTRGAPEGSNAPPPLATLVSVSQAAPDAGNLVGNGGSADNDSPLVHDSNIDHVGTVGVDLDSDLNLQPSSRSQQHHQQSFPQQRQSQVIHNFRSHLFPTVDSPISSGAEHHIEHEAESSSSRPPSRDRDSPGVGRDAPNPPRTNSLRQQQYQQHTQPLPTSRNAQVSDEVEAIARDGSGPQSSSVRPNPGDRKMDQSWRRNERRDAPNIRDNARDMANRPPSRRPQHSKGKTDVRENREKEKSRHQGDSRRRHADSYYNSGESIHSQSPYSSDDNDNHPYDGRRRPSRKAHSHNYANRSTSRHRDRHDRSCSRDRHWGAPDVNDPFNNSGSEYNERGHRSRGNGKSRGDDYSDYNSKKSDKSLNKSGRSSRPESRNYYDYQADYNRQYYDWYNQWYQSMGENAMHAGYYAELQRSQNATLNHSNTDRVQHNYESPYRPGSRGVPNDISAIGYPPEFPYSSYAPFPYPGYYPGYPGYPGYGYPLPRARTPPKFSAPHVCARFGLGGLHLVKVLDNSPKYGQPCVVEILQIETTALREGLSDDITSFPGPLSKRKPHKPDLVRFCRERADKYGGIDPKMKRDDGFDPSTLQDSQGKELLWRFMEAMVKQNGKVLGPDLAELLLQGREILVGRSMTSQRKIQRNTVNGSHQSLDGENAKHLGSHSSSSSVTDVRINNPSLNLNHYRELLAFGNKREAVEWALRHGAESHAFYLSMLIDSVTPGPTMADVVQRLEASLPSNDPILTAYFLMSHRQPPAIAKISDDSFGDWRPHMAVILSNLLDEIRTHSLLSRSVITMGNSLTSAARIPSAHFCYLMAQSGFGSYTRKNAKIVLIGQDHTVPFGEFATNEGIQLTEIYEYLMQLGRPNFEMPYFQPYKLLYASRLAELGYFKEALLYAESVAKFLIQTYNKYPMPELTKMVFDFGVKLKFFDPCLRQYPLGGASKDILPDWLERLSVLLNEFNERDWTNNPVEGEDVSASFNRLTIFDSALGSTSPSTIPLGTMATSNIIAAPSADSETYSQAPKNDIAIAEEVTKEEPVLEEDRKVVGWQPTPSAPPKAKIPAMKDQSSESYSVVAEQYPPPPEPIESNEPGPEQFPLSMGSGPCNTNPQQSQLPNSDNLVTGQIPDPIMSIEHVAHVPSSLSLTSTSTLDSYATPRTIQNSDGSDIFPTPPEDPPIIENSSESMYIQNPRYFPLPTSIQLPLNEVPPPNPIRSSYNAYVPPAQNPSMHVVHSVANPNEKAASFHPEPSRSRQNSETGPPLSRKSSQGQFSRQSSLESGASSSSSAFRAPGLPASRSNRAGSRSRQSSVTDDLSRGQLPPPLSRTSTVASISSASIPPPLNRASTSTSLHSIPPSPGRSNNSSLNTSAPVLTPEAETKDSQTVDEKKSQAGQGRSWLPNLSNLVGSILPTPPGAHQMKLPDDKDPQIVWDKEKKRWIDKSKPEAENEEDVPPPPPSMKTKPQPPAAAAFNGAPTPGPASVLPPPPSSFRMPKSRGARGRYVDVLKDAGNVSAAPKMDPGLVNPLPEAAPMRVPASSAPPIGAASETPDEAAPPMFFNPSAMTGAVTNPFNLPPTK